MDLNTWSFALSVFGAALGIISAYARVKSLSVSAIKAAGKAAVRSSERDNALADMFLEQPSALIAYITYRVIAGVIVICLSIVFFSAGGPLSLHLPSSVSNVCQLLVAAVFANLITSPLLICWKVYRQALTRATKG